MNTAFNGGGGGGVQWRMVAAAFNRNGNGLRIGKQKDGE